MPWFLTGLLDELSTQAILQWMVRADAQRPLVREAGLIAAALASAGHGELLSTADATPRAPADSKPFGSWGPSEADVRAIACAHAGKHRTVEQVVPSRKGNAVTEGIAATLLLARVWTPRSMGQVRLCCHGLSKSADRRKMVSKPCCLQAPGDGGMRCRYTPTPLPR